MEEVLRQTADEFSRHVAQSFFLPRQTHFINPTSSFDIERLLFQAELRLRVLTEPAILPANEIPAYGTEAQ